NDIINQGGAGIVLDLNTDSSCSGNADRRDRTDRIDVGAYRTGMVVVGIIGQSHKRKQISRAEPKSINIHAAGTAERVAHGMPSHAVATDLYRSDFQDTDFKNMQIGRGVTASGQDIVGELNDKTSTAA